MTKNPSSHYTVAGLVNFVGKDAKIYDCWTNTEIITTGTTSLGKPAVGAGAGLVGGNSGTIKNCYALGTVMATRGGVGLIYGNYATGVVEDCYAGDVENITALSNTQMKQATSYPNWNFVHKWAIDPAINSGYPYHKPLPAAPDFDGTHYLISTMDDLWWLTQRPDMWDKNYRQTADIDASETSNWGREGFEPIGNSFNFRYAWAGNYFTGNYDGGGHSISNLYINRPLTGFTGFFGRASGGELKNLRIADANISSTDCVSALAGLTDLCTITNCSSSGAVNATSSCVGGLIGFCKGDSINLTIDRCFSTANVATSYSSGVSTYGAGLGGLPGQCVATGRILRRFRGRE